MAVSSSTRTSLSRLVVVSMLVLTSGLAWAPHPAVIHAADKRAKSAKAIVAKESKARAKAAKAAQTYSAWCAKNGAGRGSDSLLQKAEKFGII